MSVPSHNLYDFVHQVTERQYWLLYFYPWGTRNLENARWYYNDLSAVKDPVQGLKNITALKFFQEDDLDLMLIRNFQPILFCHDQEPLNFDFYQDGSEYYQPLLDRVEKENGFRIQDRNLRLSVLNSWRQQWILLHSELNSDQLDRYESTGQYVGAYWWSHALLTLDWYRYAQHDLSLANRCPKKDFLIYARESTGTREYRKTFINLLDPIKTHCQIGSFKTDPVSSDSSSVYDAYDFVSTNISVVLETVFDQRIHLTEKTLRPIACGHPFILAGGPGSLAKIRSYGFKTFSPWINESYDNEKDPQKRMSMIVEEMTRLSQLSNQEKESLFARCQDIAQYNKIFFFSDNFIKSVKDELVNNVKQAEIKCDNRLSTSFNLWHRTQKKKHTPERVFSQPNDLRKVLVPLMRHLRVNSGSFKQYQGHQHCLDDKSSTDGDDIQ